METELENPIYSVYLNDKLTIIPEDGNYLKEGIYKVKIISDQFDNEEFNIGIKATEETMHSIKLKASIPTLMVDIPESMKVYFDGNLIDNITNFETTAGEHQILIIIDEFKISKKILIEYGKNYTLSLNMDILLEDN